MNLHIPNTEFEQTFRQKQLTISHPYAYDLQYLPFLVAEEGDFVLVRGERGNWPLKEELGLFGESLEWGERAEGLEVIPWGHAVGIENYAKGVGAIYRHPEFDVVEKVNSKAYSAGLEGWGRSEVVWEPKEIVGTVVAKSCFGFSGRGKAIGRSMEEILPFCRREWAKGLPVVIEPWVERVLDFSSHFLVGERVEYIGSAILENDSFGAYAGSICGKDHEVLSEHRETAWQAVEAVRREGFFGYLGVDGFLYREGGEVKMNPVCEINARQTVTQVLLRFQQKKFPGETLHFQFREGNPLLPADVSRQLYYNRVK